MSAIRMFSRSTVLAVLVAGGTAMAAVAQTTTAPSPVTPPAAQDQPRTDGNPPVSTSEELSKLKGVIKPPATGDAGVVTPPQVGSMPVIPPPGTPGGDPKVQPK